eukprot:292574-Hanusia_phi.AAC.12
MDRQLWREGGHVNQRLAFGSCSSSFSLVVRGREAEKVARTSVWQGWGKVSCQQSSGIFKVWLEETGGACTFKQSALNVKSGKERVERVREEGRRGKERVERVREEGRRGKERVERVREEGRRGKEKTERLRGAASTRP